MEDSNVPVSDTGKLTVEGGRRADRTRTLGEFSRTNSPLSKVEIDQRRARQWIPRTTHNIHDLKPIPE